MTDEMYSLFSFVLFCFSLATPPSLNPDFRSTISVSDLTQGLDYVMNVSWEFTKNRSSQIIVNNSFPPIENGDMLNICQRNAYELDYDHTAKTCVPWCWNGTMPGGLGCSCGLNDIFEPLKNATLNKNNCTSEEKKGQMWDTDSFRYCIGYDDAGKPFPYFLMQYNPDTHTPEFIFIFAEYVPGPSPDSLFTIPSYCKKPGESHRFNARNQIPSIFSV